MAERQKTSRGLVGLLCLANASNPLSLDMYTPAVPQMAQNLNTSDAAVSMTLTIFFLVCTIFMLISGPISDKVGRKPVMLAGALMFTIGAFACAFSPSIEILIAARSLSAAGAGCLYSGATAIVKDAFDVQTRGNVLAAMQISMLVGPVVAPIIGAFVLQITDWHGVFILIGLIGAIDVVGAGAIRETLPLEQRTSTGLGDSFAGLARTAKDGWFMRVATVKCAHIVAYMAFVAAGSFIYEGIFGFSPMEYSIAFAFTGVCMIPAAFLAKAAFKAFGEKRVLILLFAVSIVAGIVLFFIGHISWIVFIIAITVFCVYNMGTQPELANALLSSRDSDIGSASALMNFIGNAFGTIGMLLVTIPVGSYIQRIGVFAVLVMGVGAFCLAKTLVDPKTNRVTTWR